VRRAPAIIRRLLPHRLALAAAAVTVILAATLVAALASFSAGVSSDAVRTSLATNPGTTISVTALVSSPAQAAGAGRALTAPLTHALPGVPLTVWSAISSDYLDIPPGRGLPHGQTHLISLAGLSRHAELLAGFWPGPGGSAGTVPAAAPTALAGRLHLAPGTVLRLHDAVTGSPVSVRITGVFRPLSPASPYWLLDSATTGVQILGGFAVYGPLVTTPSVMAGRSIPVTSAAWSVTPDVARLGTGSLQALAGRLQPAIGTLAQLPGVQDVTVATSLPGLLSGLSTALVVARSELAIGASILLVIAGATLALATVMLSSSRQAEMTLMRTRGASRRQLAGSGAAEAGLLILPAAAAPLLGGLLLPPLGRYGPLAASGLQLAVTFPAAAWLSAAAVAAGCGVVIALPWLRAGVPAAAERAHSGRRAAVAAASRTGADLALLALAVLAGYQLEHYAAPVSTGLDGSIGIDPVLVSAPVLALAAGAVLLLRLLPLLARLGDRSAARKRGMTAAVAAWQISRRPLRQAGPALLAVLAVAVSVLAAAEWSSWQGSARDQASFTTGADVRVNLPPEAPLPPGQVTSLTAARGVTGSTPVIRTTIVLPNSGASTLLALDSGRAVSVATIRPDLAGGSPGSLLSRLAPRGPAPGALIPGRPARLQITASITAGTAIQPVLFVQLTDAFGIAYSEQAGLLPASGAAGTFTVVIAPRNQAAYPLRITGFALQYLLPAQAAANAVLSIDSVRLAATMNGSFGAPFAAASGAGLRSSASTGGAVSAPPKVLGTTAQGTALAVTFKPGAGVSGEGPPPANGAPAPTGPAIQLPASLTVTAGGQTGPLPAVATSAFAAATGQGPGSTFPVSVDGTTLTVKVASVVPAFPTITGGGGGLVVDQARLQQALAAADAQPVPVTEWWLSTSSGASPHGLPAGATVTDRASVAASLLASPLAAAPEVAMLAIAAAAVILAAAGFTVSAATAAARSRDMALLAALGATRRQLTRLLCLEQALVGVPAAAAGLVLGTLLARLVVPAVTITATGAQPLPSVLVHIPVAWPAAAAVVTAAVPVILAALGPGRRTGLAARTRLEAET
jgi:hypothetical protein